MFVEPSVIQSYGMCALHHGCRSVKCISLILSSDSERVEYTLLICARVPVSYLMDLYSLYRGIDTRPTGPGFVQTVTTLNVDEIVNPEEWLHCLKWSRFQKRGQDSSLEWFVARPKGSTFYYSIGDSGTLLVSRENPCETLRVNRETVEMVSGNSVEYCVKPLVCRVDWGMKNGLQDGL